jgi:hypothetical protein
MQQPVCKFFSRHESFSANPSVHESSSVHENPSVHENSSVYESPSAHEKKLSFEIDDFAVCGNSLHPSHLMVWLV